MAAMLERRVYPLLVLVLTAALVCVSVWRAGPGPPCCDQLSTPHHRSGYLLLNNSADSHSFDLTQLSPDDPNILLDLNFTYHKTGPVCNASAPPLFVVIVHTAPDHDNNRRAIRDTWGRTARLVFLVGETNSSAAQETLDREHDEHHDIVQGNFLDTYRNLTYKHVLGLKWVTYHCPGAKYVLKIDDDVFVNTPFLTEFLTKEMSPLGARRLVLCEVLYSAIVKRSYRSKWRVSHLEYPDRFYPDYCTGWAILYSPDVVFRLYREAQRSEYFWIDDVHITGTLLSRLNLTHTSLGPLAIPESRAYQMIDKGEIDDFLFSLLPPPYFYELWDMVTSPSKTSQKTVTSAQPWISR